MRDVVLTMVPHDSFMRFLGTLQLLLFKMNPQFFSESYLRELELLNERKIVKKQSYSFGDFTDEVFKLFGANITQLSFEEVASHVRAMLREIYANRIEPRKTRRKCFLSSVT